MKRPHSAKPPRNYWAQASSDQILTLEHSRGKVGRRTQLQNSTSNDLSRLLPKKITHDKERLYCEALNLKNNLNEITQENLRLKTRVAILQREKDKLQQRDERPTVGKNATIVVGKGDKQNGMIANLKKMVREAREESEGVKLELAKLKRTIRYTKLNECQIERQTVLQQNRKQAKLIVQLRMELETRVRQQDQVNQLQAELRSKTKELQETNHDNLQYEQILTEMEERYAETGEKLMVLEKKYQRDMAVERRKAENMGRINEGLKAQVKKLKTELEEEKKKVKKVIRPVSSNSYKSESVRGKEKEGEVMEAIVVNQKLQKELEEAKKKLAQSQQMLKSHERIEIESVKKQKNQEKPITVVSPIHGNSLNINSVIKEDDQYADDFEISHLPTAKPTKKEEQKPIPPPVVSLPPPPIISNQSPIHKEIRQILTYRMKYNRYPFSELKADIQVSPLSRFTFTDLLSMLTSQPFFLSEKYAREFLKTCYGRSKMNDEAELDVDVLLTHLRKIIDDFQLIDEQQEEDRMHRLAEVLTKNRKTIEQQLAKVAKKGLVSKEQLVSILSQYAGITTNEIDVGICYVSVNAMNLSSISYLQLLDKFMLTASPKKRNSQTSEARKEEHEELSLGENDDFELGQPISDDQLI